jgi:hypothetical protein
MLASFLALVRRVRAAVAGNQPDHLVAGMLRARAHGLRLAAILHMRSPARREARVLAAQELEALATYLES